MTAEEYKKKLITYLKHNIKLCECNKEVEQENCEHYSKRETFDFHKVVDSNMKVCGAKQRIAQLHNLITDIKDGTVENILEE